MNLSTRLMGVEEEFFILDAKTGAPQPGAAIEVVQSAAAELPIEHEFLSSQVEITTPPCSRLSDIEAHLNALRDSASAIASERGLRLSAAGTPPVQAENDQEPRFTDDPRYRIIAADGREVAKQHLISGMHVHVSIESAAEGVRALNGLARWAPLLMAMTANSPFSHGKDTGFQSWRHIVSCAWPLNTYPPYFASSEEYDRRILRLLQSGLIRDRGLVSWHVRLSSKYPTLEVRLADVQLNAADAACYAAIIRALVDSILSCDDPELGPHEGLPEVDPAIWRASRDGLEGTLIDPFRASETLASTWLDQLLIYIGPALQRTGDESIVHGYTDRLMKQGTPAVRQRRAFAVGGLSGLLDLTCQSYLTGPA